MVLHALTTTVALGPKWLDSSYLLSSLGGWALPIISVIIFAECGILIGFFLPGDSLLFPLGLFIAKGYVQTPLWVACLILSACAVLGNVVGYGIGYAAGPKLFSKPDSKLFKREYVERTHMFFDKYGTRAIFLARFVPIIRCFITAVAGVGRMEPKRYFSVSIVGGIIWASGVTVAGYFLGQIDFIASHVDLILVLIVLISVIPIVIEWARHRKESTMTTRPIPRTRV
ncbi:MAG TPA: VTT domain-containing protein [Pseudonocardiaceae bacterium]|jgi:membrane-associated protein|nr:VTT domain-containing protein [Pseudonocardiaceae bacterium]